MAKECDIAIDIRILFAVWQDFSSKYSDLRIMNGRRFFQRSNSF